MPCSRFQLPASEPDLEDPRLDFQRSYAISRGLGLAFGSGLAILEVVYNWGNPSWWPFILVDYIAVALLLFGALRSPRILAAGWGFACAMFYMAFFFSLEAGRAGPVLWGMGALFGLTILGLTLSLRAALHEGSPT